jgi:spore coat protein U-like protein
MRFPIAFFSILCAWLAVGSSAIGAPTCKVDVRPIVFGGYNPLLPNSIVNSTGSIDVSCSINALPLSTIVNYSIGISPGLSGSHSSRRMVRGADFLTYNISNNSAMSPVWGDFSGGTPVGGLLSGFTALDSYRTNNHIMYAVLYPRQLGRQLGDYADLLNVTVYF